MDVHFFQKLGCLAVVSRDKVLFVRQNGVIQLALGENFSSGIDCVSFHEASTRIALSCKRNIAVISLPSGENTSASQVTTVLERNSSTLSWCPSGNELVAGDKSGGIWTVSIGTLSSDDATSQLKPALIGSRVAVVLALCICGTEKSRFLAVGDRDGRLSLFHYPAVHNLHQVCLGHSQYIAALTVPDSERWPNHILSLGGDGIVCLWNVITGACAARVALFEDDSSALSHNRPKSLLLLKSTVDAESKRSSSVWLVFGEHSSTIHAFTLSGCTDSDNFELNLESICNILSECIFETPVCAATACGSSLILVTGDTGKSHWPWKCLKENFESAMLLEKLASYLAANDNRFDFSLRSPRSWLERHPHQHVAEYYAKRKKGKVVAGKEESLPDSDSSCSDVD